jgi:YhcH/YjgK/YiaL family protein
MVSDSLANAGLYAALGPRIARGLAFLGHADLEHLSPGRHEIDGDALYAIVSDYAPKPESEGRWEAHRRYLDLQFVAHGAERIGVAPLAGMTAGDYSAEKDICFLTGSGDFLTLTGDRFVLLWPTDAHMPGIEAGRPGPVRKIVVKIAAA